MSGTARPSLPRNPSRDNYSHGCETRPDDSLPEHLDRCDCPEHTGVCRECKFKVTLGPSGLEYGHARATNRRADENGVRRDCPHRPTACNTGEEHVWGGYEYHTRGER